MNTFEQSLIAEIRMELLKHEAMGVDTSLWHDKITLAIIDRLSEELRRVKKEKVNG